MLDQSNLVLAALKRYLWKSDRLSLGGIHLRHDRLADENNRHSARAFCFVFHNARSHTIHCALALENLPERAQVGILLHEIGHILVQDETPDEEVSVDEYVLQHFPETGYHYATVHYRGLTGRLRTAKNIECVSEKFIKQLLG